MAHPQSWKAIAWASMDALTVAVTLVSTMVKPLAVWFNAARLMVPRAPTTAVKVTVYALLEKAVGQVNIVGLAVLPTPAARGRCRWAWRSFHTRPGR